MFASHKNFDMKETGLIALEFKLNLNSTELESNFGIVVKRGRGSDMSL